MVVTKTELANTCPCHGKVHKAEGFEKVVELKEKGLVIFCHTVPTYDVNNTTASQDLVVLQNKNKMKLTYTDVLQQMDKNNITCPRCKQILRHTQELLNNQTEKRNLIGICGHCRVKLKSEEACNKCDDVVKKFLSLYGKQKKGLNQRTHMWIDMHFKKKRSYSEMDFDLLKLESSKAASEIDIKSMFHSEENLSRIEPLKKGQKKQKYLDVRFTQETVEIFRAKRSTSSMTALFDNEEIIEPRIKSAYVEKYGMGNKILSDDSLVRKLEQNVEKSRLTKEELAQLIIPKKELMAGYKKLIQSQKQVLSESDINKDISFFFLGGSDPALREPRARVDSVEIIRSARNKILLEAEKEAKKQSQNRAKEELKFQKRLANKKGAKPGDQEDKGSSKKIKLTDQTDKDAEQNVNKIMEIPKEPRVTKNDLSKKGNEILKDRDNSKKKTTPVEDKGTSKKKPEFSKDKDSSKKKLESPKDIEFSKKKPEPTKGIDFSKKKPESQKDIDSPKNKQEISKKLDHSDSKSGIHADNKVAFKKIMEQSKDTKLGSLKDVFTIKTKVIEKSLADIKDVKIGNDKSKKGKDLEESQKNITNKPNDNLILSLIKLKQMEDSKRGHIDKKGNSGNLSSGHGDTDRLSTSAISDSSSLLSIMGKPPSEIQDIIIGEKLTKYRPASIRQLEAKPEQNNQPELFQIEYSLADDTVTIPLESIKQKSKPSKDQSDTSANPKGIMRYALSDRTFIEKGWTVLPTEKVLRKMNVYRMRPAHPEFDWFERNKNKRLLYHSTGEKLADFDDNGRGRWYYKNGRLALDYYDAEETNAQQRFVVYSSGEPDERGRSYPRTILATFDYLGNGIVFDHAGKIRLKYNQTEGVVLDRNIGPVSHWKWHTLNDPPELQKVMIDTQVPHKDPTILSIKDEKDSVIKGGGDESMLAIEFDNAIKQEFRKVTQETFKPFQIKMKALKINENFSLKVLDQATVYLIFRDGSTNLRVNIGMVLDHQEIIDTDIAEVGEVSNSIERFPARTDSIAGLQRSIDYAQQFERTRTERERRTRPTVPCLREDKLIAATSRPLRPQLKTVPTASVASTSNEYCRCIRKRSNNNMYYNSRLM